MATTQSPERVLVVDDEESILHFLKAALQRKSYQVLTATNGKEALDLFAQHRPDLVILDIRLPGEDGISVLRKIRKKDRKALVLMITGYGSKQSISEAMKLGASDYIAKPFDLKDMLRCVGDHLSMGTLARSAENLKPRLP